MDRGDRRESIFLTDEDRRLFLRTLAETCERTGFVIHAHVLMGNHYHLLLETPEPNLVAGMKWLQGTYTQRFNRRHQLVGHLFQGRYKSIPIEGENDGYFRSVAEYIHLNPARAGLLNKKNPDLRDYPWSSFNYFLGAKRHLSRWLTPVRTFASMGLIDNPQGRLLFRDHLNFRARQIFKGENDPLLEKEWKAIRRGWYLGSNHFGHRLLKAVDSVLQGKKRESFGGPEMACHDQLSAEKLLINGLQTLGMTLEDIRHLRHNNAHKQGLAALVKSRTIVGDSWLAEKLQMGHRSNISRAVNVFANPKDPLRQRLKEILHKCTD